MPKQSRVVLSLLILLVSTITMAQFPFKKGKESSIVLPSISGSKLTTVKTINIDLSDSRFGFSRTGQKIAGSDETPLATKFDDKIIKTVNLGFALNENSFAIFDKTLKPGVDFDWTRSKLIYEPTDFVNKKLNYRSFVFKPFVELKNVKNAEVLTSGKLDVNDDNLRADVGISFGHNWYLEKTTTGLQRVISLYATGGYSYNNEEDLKEKEILDLPVKYINTKGDSVQVQSGKKYFIGELENKAFFRLTTDWAFKLSNLKESETAGSTYSSTNLFLLVRGAVEVSSVSKPKYNFFIGPSITKYSRQVIGALLFELQDIGSLNDDNDFDDIMKVNLYFGIPIPFK